jgi:tetrahydromethanopterin S-methyltransferase subunit G
VSSSALEARMAHLEGSYEQINHRLGTVETRLSNLETKVDNLSDRMDGRFDRIENRLDRRINFLYGLIVVSIMIPLVSRFAIH